MSVHFTTCQNAIPSRVGMPPSRERIAAFLEQRESKGTPLYLIKNNVKCLYKKHTVSKTSGVFHVFFNRHPTLGSDNKVHTEFNWPKILDSNFSGAVASSMVNHQLVSKFGYTSYWASYAHTLLSSVVTANEHIEIHQSSDLKDTDVYESSDYSTFTYTTASQYSLTASWGSRSVFLQTPLASDVGCTSFINIKNSQVVMVNPLIYPYMYSFICCL